jgi:phage shock protein A
MPAEPVTGVRQALSGIAMTEETDDAFNAMASRLIRREALRRAALELSTTTPQGLESALAQISAEVTAEAAEISKTP